MRAYLLLRELHRTLLLEDGLFLFDFEHDGQNQQDGSRHDDPSRAAHEFRCNQAGFVDLGRLPRDFSSPCGRNDIRKGVDTLKESLDSASGT